MIIVIFYDGSTCLIFFVNLTSMPGQSTTPMKGECSLVPMTADTPTSACAQEVITAARSPHVQSSVHEECAWFTLEEARLKSPVFEQIFQTEQFKKLLSSITSPQER